MLSCFWWLCLLLILTVCRNLYKDSRRVSWGEIILILGIIGVKLIQKKLNWIVERLKAMLRDTPVIIKPCLQFKPFFLLFLRTAYLSNSCCPCIQSGIVSHWPRDILRSVYHKVCCCCNISHTGPGNVLHNYLGHILQKPRGSMALNTALW